MWTDHRSAGNTVMQPADDELETKGNARPNEAMQARAVLQALSGNNCWLAKEMLGNGPRWAVFAEAGLGARLVLQVAQNLVRQLQQEKLIEAVEDNATLRWRISTAGRHWLAQYAPIMAAGTHAHMTTTEPRHYTSERAISRQGGKAAKKSKGRAARKRNTRQEAQRLLLRDAETGSLREVAVNIRENPLMWLARRKDANGRPYLEPHHVAAGERLRQDYETACMQPNITASWNPALVAADRGRLKSGPRDPFPFTERAMLARERVHKALDNIGPELADVAVSVCCLGNGIEAAERTLNWPRRSARLVLRIALERLADHYGLKPTRAAPAPGWRRALHWHAEDGRPNELVPADATSGRDQAKPDNKE